MLSARRPDCGHCLADGLATFDGALDATGAVLKLRLPSLAKLSDSMDRRTDRLSMDVSMGQLSIVRTRVLGCPLVKDNTGCFVG